LSGLRTT